VFFSALNTYKLKAINAKVASSDIRVSLPASSNSLKMATVAMIQVARIPLSQISEKWYVLNQLPLTVDRQKDHKDTMNPT
jgi:hypothetical protein